MKTREASTAELIVALDVERHEEALAIVRALDNVRLFKIGLEGLLGGSLPGLCTKIRHLRGPESGVFVDLKLSGDTPRTLERFTARCAALGVRFITLDVPELRAKTARAVEAMRSARGANPWPRLLAVPMYSSMDAGDLDPTVRRERASTQEYIVERARRLLALGCDGLIVSGDAIGACREAFPPACLVSPGIRSAAAQADDHEADKDVCDPADSSHRAL